MPSNVLGKLLTGPLAFLLAGMIDVFAYWVQAAFRAARRWLAPSTISRR